MFGMNGNVPNLMGANGMACGGYADYLQEQSEDMSAAAQQCQEAEQKANEQIEEKKKADYSQKDTGVFSPLAGNSWSAAGAITNQAEQFFPVQSPLYSFSAVA